MEEYDIYLRHASVGGGEWVGFHLAWRGLGGAPLPGTRPHAHWWPWVLDPAAPHDPTRGDWGVEQWRVEVALIEGVASLLWSPPGDDRSVAEMRADLLAYRTLPALELKDAGGTAHTVKMTAYTEHGLEPYTAAHPQGGYLAVVEFAAV